MRSITFLIFTGLLIITPSFIRGTNKNVDRIVVTLPASLPVSSNEKSLEVETNFLYDSLQLQQRGLAKQTLLYALKGFNYLQSRGLLYKENILSICDFSQSSKKKRLYIIDMENKRLLLNTYVAHGRNSGSEYPGSFSNTPESLKSSLGFYVTRNTYHGGHGLSLKIDGVEPGFNDKANSRNIVVHGADYVGADFLRYNAFSGRSYGCPAVPANQTPLVINTIKDGTCLFIYHPTKTYLDRSRILNS
jgi:hypothetical protein